METFEKEVRSMKELYEVLITNFQFCLFIYYLVDMREFST